MADNPVGANTEENDARIFANEEQEDCKYPVGPAPFFLKGKEKTKGKQRYLAKVMKIRERRTDDSICTVESEGNQGRFLSIEMVTGEAIENQAGKGNDGNLQHQEGDGGLKQSVDGMP